MAKNSDTFDITSSVLGSLGTGILFILIGIDKEIQAYSYAGIGFLTIAFILVVMAIVAKYNAQLAKIAQWSQKLVPLVIIPATIFAIFYKYMELIVASVKAREPALSILYFVTVILGVTFLGWVIYQFQLFRSDFRRKAFKILSLDLIFSVLINYWVLRITKTDILSLLSPYFTLGVALLFLFLAKFWEAKNELQKALLIFGCVAILFGAAAATDGQPSFDLAVNILSIGMMSVCISTILSEGNLIKSINRA